MTLKQTSPGAAAGLGRRPKPGDDPENPTGRNASLQPVQTRFDIRHENSVRPKTLAEYCGQRALKDDLSISMAAAKQRREPLDHLLFYGPPGLGKTSLAHVLATEMGASLTVTSAPALERPRDLVGILMALEPGSVVFIDEIHRLSKVAEELLYPAMEDFVLDRSVGKGAATRVLQVPLPRFTLIGATTRAGAIAGPLRDRFGHVHRLNFYEPEELATLLARSAGIWQIELKPEAANAIARRARGTPRIANRLLRRVRDFAQVRGEAVITAEAANAALDAMAIDRQGLDATDRLYLDTLSQHFGGGPVGVETLATAIGEDARTIEDVIEPYLMQSGLIQRTPRGRMLSTGAKLSLFSTTP